MPSPICPIADHLQSGPLSPAEVARRENAVVDNTFRLMWAALAIGLLTADSRGRFCTTPLLDTLRRDAEPPQRAWILARTGSTHWMSWNEFVDVIRTGANAPQRALGSDIYTYFEQNPDEGREFRDGMTSMTTMWAPYVVQLINTGKVSCAVDVGGADGSLLARMQRANEDLHGISFERPQVAAEVERQVFEGEFGDRTEDRCRRLLRRRAGRRSSPAEDDLGVLR